jgi:hypothetical protein
MTDSTHAHKKGSLPEHAVLPYRLRPDEAVDLSMRAEWRRFLPLPDVEDFYDDGGDLIEDSAEWRRLLPDRIDYDLMRGAVEEADMEYDDGKPVYHMPRKLMVAIILLMLVTLLAYELYGLFSYQPPTPPPTPNVPMFRV